MAENDWQEIPLTSEEESESTLQTTKDLLRGVAQGATFSFADELAGAGETGLDILQDPDKLNQFLKLYQQHRDESRQAFKEARERSPYASFTGELLGGLTIPGIGTAKAGLTGAKTLGQAVTRGALTGAGVGSLYGTGASEADLTEGEVGELAGDVATSGAYGAAFGGALSSIVPGAKAVGSKLKEKDLLPEIVENIGEAFKKEKAGEKLVGKKARRQIEENVEKESKNLTQALRDEVERGRELKTLATESAEKAGLKLNIQEILKKYEQKAMMLPERRSDQIKEKDEILRLIRNELYGPETEKQLIIPAKTEVIRGETLPSGEEKAIESLKKRMAQLNAQKELGKPEKVAELRLRENFALKELTSEEPRTVPFRTPEKIKTSAEIEGLAGIGPEGERLARVIKDINPSDIKIVTDPTTNKKVAALLDQNNIPIATQVVSDEAAQTLVKFKKIPEKIETITERTGGIQEYSPKNLNQLINDFKGITSLGEHPVKGPEAAKVVNDMTKELKSSLRGASMGEFGNQIKEGDKIMAAALDAEEILSPALRGLSGADRVKAEQAISSNIGKLEKEGEGGRGARQIARAVLNRIKETNPELVKKLEKRLIDTATSYDLARQIGAESAIQGSLVGTVQAKVIGAGGLAGRAVRKLSELPKTMKSFISGSNPETLRITREALSKGENIPSDLLNKLKAAEEAPSNTLRNSILFSIMQTPEYRSLLGITGYEE